MTRRRRIGNFCFLICKYDYRAPLDEFSKSVEAVIENFEKDEILAGVPIHWHFPAILIDKAPKKIQSRFRLRIAAGSDLYLSMGYSGLPHPMLFPSEIGLELEWGSTNVSPTIAFPRWPDTLRKSASYVYARVEEPMMVSYGSFCELVAPGGSRTGTYDPISIVEVSSFEHAHPRRLVREAAARDVAFSATGAEIERAIGSGSLHRFLYELIRRGKRTLTRISDLMNDTGRSSGPVIRSRRSSSNTSFGILESIRFSSIPYRREDIVQATRTVGGINAAYWERRFTERANVILDADSPRGIRNKPERILVSDMSGSVVLAGDHICCQFDAGQITEIRGEVPAVALRTPSSMWIKCHDLVEFFSVESAFSFDEPDMRGLQERLVCESCAFREPIRIDLDTFFIDSAETLFLSIAIEFPEAIPGREVSEIHPLVLQLESDLDDPYFTTRFPGGERNDVRPVESAGFQNLWTAGLEIPTHKGTLHLFTPEGPTVAVEHVLMRRLDRHLFELSLGGTGLTESAADLAGTRREWIWCIEILQPGQTGSSILSAETFDRLARSYDLNVTSPA